jgi:hypothetical protein
MPPHITTAIILIGIIAAFIGVFKFVHYKDNRKEQSENL